MRTRQPADGAYRLIRPQGALPKFDISVIAKELVSLQTGAEALRVLFDWSRVESWPFAAPPAAARREWNEVAPAIVRAAFIHDAKWNRHAAILAALLRINNVEAQSFRRVDAAKAIEWLEQASRKDDLSLDGASFCREA